MLDEQLANRRGIARVGRGGRTRPQRRRRAAQGEAREGRAQILGKRREQRGVHGAVVRELLAHQPLGGRDLPCTCDRLGIADEHGLVGAVVHRQVQLAARLAGDPPGARGVRADREQHRRRHLVALGGVGVGGVEAVAEGGQPLIGVDVERAHGHRCGVLTGAVAEHRVAAGHQPRDHRVHGGVGRQHRLDCDIELHQPRLSALALSLREGGTGIYPVAEQMAAPVIGVEPVDPVECRARLCELEAQISEHSRVLRALPGEHEHELGLAAERLGLVVDARRRLDPRAVGLTQLLDRLAELLPEVLGRGGHHRQAPWSRDAAERVAEGVREIPERELGLALQCGHQLARRVGECLRRVALEDADLAVPWRPVVGGRRAVPLLEHRVGVDAAEAERVDAGAPRLGAAMDPGPRLGVDVERRSLEAELRIRLLAAQRRRQQPVVKCERGLDQAGDAGGGDRVTDHRLDRPQGAPRQLAVALPEHPRQRLHLDHVPDRRARAVRLDQPDAVRRDPGGGVRAPQRQLLSLDARRHHAHPPPVARDADTTDHRVHAVAVADRVIHPLEHDGADSLAQQCAVGVLVERTQLLAARERAEPAEQVQRRHRHPHLRAAGER